ncbi:MAG: hypothetical protein FJX64_10230 [Alphaproteobacteria bacterium]|nr:hypothetical protein [Alphaproteobacteria bacterium]
MSSRRNVVTALGLLAIVVFAAIGGYFYLSGPLHYAVEGPAAVPAAGRLLIKDHVVHLEGLVSPREDTDCRIGPNVLQCNLIAHARLIEMVAGKTVRCDVTRYKTDERNWGRCTVAKPDAALFADAGGDINRALVRTGWAIADQQHTLDYVEDGAQARGQRRGLWQAAVAERRVDTNVLAGVPVVKDGDTLELMEVDIHLRGVDAPDLYQTCTMNRIPYECGLRARANLINLLAGIPVVCHVKNFQGDDRVWGICGQDDGTRRDIAPTAITLNQAVVASGWAVARADPEIGFGAAEAKARNERAGMWVGQFVRPVDWRRGVR